MKIAIVVVRSLMGALFIFGSITYLFNLITPPEQTGNMKIFSDGLQASGYLLNLIKVTELVCGIAFITGRFVPLALVVISPVIVNILFVHIFLSTAGLPVAIFLVASNSFLAYAHRKSFTPLLKPKTD
jgi:uncharacterized membrane protein YphA (DoxX/SURF4 family)